MYKNIFIDLDRTIWDFDTNSGITIEELFFENKIQEYCDFEEFINVYKEFNKILWEQYRQNKISRDFLSWNRFYLALENFGIIDEQLSKNIGAAYLEISPLKTALIPHAEELLKYLHKKYNTYIITNGFKEVQYSKIKNCGLENYFDKIFISEEVGFNKPDTRFFEYVLNETSSQIEDSIIIGDDIEADIQGATNSGIDSIWLNAKEECQDVKYTYEVSSLFEIFDIL